uniref:Alpha-ketoglutarate-dependent dioxygenase AlkB-like domain-containing protein n=1 Tax=Chromera velia CCMP2878 TaxID=1169474 RepID=A0A0G4G3Q6_9ALVE|eukprot:Cvel_20140.t1-p1 / transcript=Cvel_20140.t1 / gene=Cvel_20140 / organism=Chromera_velia_CCMP2878 / gene_product=hypothetical protein / transcript_product=hypothetical protein / location=Cvel_scaffold1787:5867-6940(+) / protein_length=358 / sequence_SO=supercontig / SO=protein_coding / is_pseudo=false
MAPAKQTAQKSTGGKAPRKQPDLKAARKRPVPKATRRFESSLYDPLFSAPPVSPEDLGRLVQPPVISPNAQWIELAPGLVHVKDAITEEQQVILARHALYRGCQTPPLGFRQVMNEETGELGPNAEPNAGRGREYLEKEAQSVEVQRVGEEIARETAARYPTDLPEPVITHILTLHYSRGNPGFARVSPGIFWHKDDGANDGHGTAPIFALSLGESCRFLMMENWRFVGYKERVQNGELHDITLESGDLLVMGGPSRYIHHCIPGMKKGSCPDHLKAILGSARVNITWRSAPGVNAADYVRQQLKPSRGKKIGIKKQKTTSPASSSSSSSPSTSSSAAAAADSLPPPPSAAPGVSPPP